MTIDNSKLFCIFAAKIKTTQLMIVANPIYDVVSKYLMEDERITCVILPVLLKKDVVKVKKQHQPCP